GNAVAIDPLGNVYVTGTLDETGIGGVKSGFVAEYTAGTLVNYFTFQANSVDGALFNTQSNGIAVDGSGLIYVVGTANDPAHPTPNNEHILQLSNDGGTIVGSATYGHTAALPGAPNAATGVALDGAGHVVISGMYSPSTTETEITYAFWNTSDVSNAG